MRGELFAAGLIAASICASAGECPAATVTLPTTHATLYLVGEIHPFWMTFALDADIDLLPHDSGDGPVSHYILNIGLSNTAGTTTIRFAKIEGAEAENGLYGPDGPPRLLFSETIRALHITPNATFFNANLLSATLRATLPDGLQLVSEEPTEVAAAVEALTESLLPGTAPLFASGLGAIALLTWRQLRKAKRAH